MTTNQPLSVKYVSLAPGANYQVFERNGAIIGSAPIEEYIRFIATGLTDNQTAIFDLSKLKIDFIPLYIVAVFSDLQTSTGIITLNFKYNENIILTMLVDGDAAAVGYSLPQIPINYENTTLEITTVKACNSIWISGKQISLFSEISQDRVV